MQYEVLFDVNPDSANYGKIVATLENPSGPVVTEQVFIEVISPGGLIKLADIATPTPDAVISTGDPATVIELANVPKTSNGDWLKGTYKVNVFIRPAASSDTPTETKYTYFFSPLDTKDDNGNAAVALNAGFDLNCFTGELKLYDYTDTTDWDTVTRALTIVHPTGNGLPVLADTTGTSTELSITIGYVNVTYQGTVVLTLEETTTPDADMTLKTSQKVTGNYSFLAACEYDLCGLVSCIEKELNDLNALASSCGGWYNLPQYEIDKWLQLQSLIEMHNLYSNCGNTNKIRAFYDRILDTLGKDCTCNQDDGQPRVFTPVGSGSGGNVSVIGSSSVSVTGGPVYQITLSQAYIDLLGLLKVVSIQSSDGSIDVASVTTATTIDFDITLPAAPTFSTLDPGTVADYLIDPSEPVKYRINRENQLEIQGRFQVTGTSGLLVSEEGLPTAAMPQSASLVRWNGYDGAGNRVGVFNLVILGGDTLTSLQFTPTDGFSYASLNGSPIIFNAIIQLGT